MSRENDEKVVKEIIEYANKEIKKSKKKHFMILLLILIIIVLLSVSLLLALIYDFEGGHAMWVFWGITSIITAILNVIWTLRHRETKWFRFISLSCTALTICSFYSLAKRWVLTGAADQLLDIMPTLSAILWYLTILSIIINGISLFIKKDE